MTQEEIEAAYADASVPAAFQALEAAGVDNATVAVVLGQETAWEYASWIDANLNRKELSL